MIWLENLILRPSELEHDNEMDYEKYGFEVGRIFYQSGKETGYKAILNSRTGKIIHVASDKYKLLPNEVVLEMANEVADEMGLVPFKTVVESIADWKTWKSRTLNAGGKSYTKHKKAGRVLVNEIPGSAHVLLDSNCTNMFAFYKMPEIVNMDKNEQFHFGLAVRNSIDGTSKLSIDGFSYRFICQNMSVATIQQIAKVNEIDALRRRHTINLEVTPSNLKTRMEFVVHKIKDLQKVYGRWMVEELNKDIVTKLGRTIPVTYLPEYIQVEKKKVTLTADPTPTKWKTYNDITAEVWHRPVELKTKQILFEKLHTAYGL